MSDRSSPGREVEDGAEPLTPPRARGLNTMYTRRQLEFVLQRERARADRNRCEFSLILFRARAEERRLTLRLARLLNRRCRSIDELGWFEESCIAVLLPYTGADGARAFAESALKLAQDDLIPAVCRVYTYPTAWYFEEDRDRGAGGSGPSPRRRSDTDVASNENGNGHAKGNGNAKGNGQANGNGQAKAHAASDPASNGNGHHRGNGEGQSVSWSSGNGDGNGSGNGNGHPKAALIPAHGSTIASGSVVPAATLVVLERRAGVADAVSTLADAAAARTGLTENDLVPYVLQGLSDGLCAPDAGADGVETLLVRRLPWWKRSIDIIGATFGLVALSPVMIFAAIMIKGTSRGPVIFKQRRAGLGGQPFWIYKFRTMTADAEQRKAQLRPLSEQDGPAFKLTDDPRLTPIGKVLRETSLDELPQLWNVLKGDMSLVGPRPLPMDESAECEQWQRRRLDVTPGLTCIWQVKGRSRVSFAEWMRMDVNYIRRRTLWHDVRILAETIPAVLLRRGAR